MNLTYLFLLIIKKPSLFICTNMIEKIIFCHRLAAFQIEEVGVPSTEFRDAV